MIDDYLAVLTKMQTESQHVNSYLVESRKDGSEDAGTGRRVGGERFRVSKVKHGQGRLNATICRIKMFGLRHCSSLPEPIKTIYRVGPRCRPAGWPGEEARRPDFPPHECRYSSSYCNLPCVGEFGVVRLQLKAAGPPQFLATLARAGKTAVRMNE